jgi:hypothetical protein
LLLLPFPSHSSLANALVKPTPDVQHRGPSPHLRLCLCNRLLWATSHPSISLSLFILPSPPSMRDSRTGLGLPTSSFSDSYHHH